MNHILKPHNITCRVISSYFFFAIFLFGHFSYLQESLSGYPCSLQCFQHSLTFLFFKLANLFYFFFLFIFSSIIYYFPLNHYYYYYYYYYLFFPLKPFLVFAGKAVWTPVYFLVEYVGKRYSCRRWLTISMSISNEKMAVSEIFKKTFSESSQSAKTLSLS